LLDQRNISSHLVNALAGVFTAAGAQQAPSFKFRQALPGEMHYAYALAG